MTSDQAGLQLNGTKHCTTGTLYADHVIVAADQSGKRIAVPLDTGQPRVKHPRRLEWLRAFLPPPPLQRFDPLLKVADIGDRIFALAIDIETAAKIV
ncbi:hypothetical protein I6F35_38840 [Bradyrhizobium sp. BRP22]|uniref:hypothetical protein n=1 Tax=Bradyrhizobium sp. BRP22 TaxID=2793821 RepID=UPI001CD22918|nr:hypothetical protein [Bradyrhizobium sp. BRP22]MCA1458994.1 hypothetical protein [Bradyrhizobium sp. BRP22]